MYYRLAYLAVTNKVKANRVFNFDETGVRLLYFGDIGRAQAGQKNVKWWGYDDKGQFTLSVIMDALGRPGLLIQHKSYGLERQGRLASVTGYL